MDLEGTPLWVWVWVCGVCMCVVWCVYVYVCSVVCVWYDVCVFMYVYMGFISFCFPLLLCLFWRQSLVG